MCSVYTSKVNSNCEKQIILLMIPNEKKEGCHYFSAKETINIMKRNNVKTPRQLLLFKLYSFFYYKKQT